ncbi:AraC family transcriptional regulator [Caulobacter segnis]|uniref:Transcriptional regulator, AraC family n=2 Tax=Caulobacter segnis TaxID=88688 RepID=D5VK49_CAUST|nr:AraC family transcriptional regulator [Caulobacter segnis]ADG10872.1 transcriptional regulator, AraC family [Caulobacter segnis ATCC 21756]AVQ02573.1 AraC family transcriptional regulator [Caulobacter segnis]
MTAALHRSALDAVPIDFAGGRGLTLRTRSLRKSKLQIIEVDYGDHGGGGNASFPRLEDTYLVGVRYRAEQSRTSVHNEVFDYGSPAGHSHFLYVSGVDYVELNTHSHTLELLLPRAFMREVADDLESPGPLKLGETACFIRPDPVIPRMARLVRPYLDDPTTLDPFSADSFMWAFGLYVMQRYGGLRDHRPIAGGLTSRQERMAKEWIEATLPVGTTLSELAQGCGLGVSRFARAFRISTGVTPYGWVISRRIERAKILLKASLPLAHIALACGFADQSHMSRTFKRATGMAPRTWQLASQVRVSDFG